jgi:hypothetical protein
MKFCAAILLLIASAFAQPSASVRGRVVDPNLDGLPSTVRLISVDNSQPEKKASTEFRGAFRIDDITPGWYLLSAKIPGFRQAIKAVRIESDAWLDTGDLVLPLSGCDEPGVICDSVGPEPPPPAIQILTVCEALRDRDAFYQRQVVLVSMLSGDRLRQDCEARLRTGAFGWPNEIALTGGVTIPRDFKWDDRRIREKAATITRRPGDQLVAVFGRLASPAGIEQGPAADLKELNFTFITLSHDPASIRILK